MHKTRIYEKQRKCIEIYIVGLSTRSPSRSIVIQLIARHERREIGAIIVILKPVGWKERKEEGERGRRKGNDVTVCVLYAICLENNCDKDDG